VVLRGFGNGHVKLGISPRVRERIAFADILPHRVEGSTELAQVGLACVNRRMVRSHCLEPIPDLLDILRCLWVAMEQMDQRIRNRWRRHIGDRKAATASRSQESARLELEQGFTPRRSRNVEPLGKVPFGGKQLPGPQLPIYDQLLDLFPYRVGKPHATRGLDSAKCHTNRYPALVRQMLAGPQACINI